VAQDRITLLFSSSDDDPKDWCESLKQELGADRLDMRVWPDSVGARDDIKYALVWRHPHGDLANYPNLKCILSLAAGPEAVLEDPGLPDGVPVVRLVDTSLTDDIVLYCVHWVLHLHREFDRYLDANRAARWERFGRNRSCDTRVGILGLGVLGGRVASALTALEYTVAGWSRSPKDIAGIESFHGDAGLTAFLARTDILICLLPLTDATRDILDAAAFAALPSGAFLINAGRGAHVVDDSLLAALDSGHLGGAVLDVFREEPLPSNHVYWSHPKVVVTPHIAGRTHPHTAAAVVAENIRRVERGEAPQPIINPKRQY
jgi:glyoxylate/hydroxypyruvate reductase